MSDLVASAQSSVDIAELYQYVVGDGGPEKRFLHAISKGLIEGHKVHPNQEPVVRILIGLYPPSIYSAGAFAHALQRSVGRWLRVQSGYMRSQLTSWNHAKVLDVDGRAAMVGGMNYWDSDYLDTTHPVNDVSMEVVGPAAADLSSYLDVLWSWTCGHRHHLGVGVTLSKVPACIRSISTLAPVSTTPGVTIMVLGHLGNGISVPGEPYREESGPFQRPPPHGNKCAFYQRDYSDTNNSRSYEYRNPGEDALRALIKGATKSIFISQQDLLSCLPKPAVASEAKFDERLFAVLAGKVAEGVPIKIVLSTPSSGLAEYSNGWSLKHVAETLKLMVEKQQRLSPGRARAEVCRDVGLASIRSDSGSRWRDGKPFDSHAKLVAVDDEAFYIGSENLYPARLQELGLIVEDAKASAELKADYLDPLWRWSGPDALIDPTGGKCGSF